MYRSRQWSPCTECKRAEMTVSCWLRSKEIQFMRVKLKTQIIKQTMLKPRRTSSSPTLVRMLNLPFMHSAGNICLGK